MIDPEIGFTSDVIKDPLRFVGRAETLRDCIQALSSPVSLIAIYGKRGVGKSSLLRQIQNMALGDYGLPKKAGLHKEIPDRPRRYLSVYYSCDSLIKNGTGLLQRLCTDQNEEDGLLRLVPNDGKEIVEFTRSKEVHAGADLKVVNWGAKGIESSKYARVVPDDDVQTFRNFVSAVVSHQVHKRMKRDGLLVLLDEFDVIEDKHGIGSLIKSLTSEEVKFGICGIGHDLYDLVEDHGSVERLLEQGAIAVEPMPIHEILAIFERAEELFDNRIVFCPEVKQAIAEISKGYPYFAQMFGKACVSKANQRDTARIDSKIYDQVLDDVKRGKAFPTLESLYQRAIGASTDRQMLLHLLAEQPEERTEFTDDIGRIFLKRTRKDAEEFNIQFIDQLLPRLLDKKFGPVLARVPEKPGIYEFINPVFRLYVHIRTL
jgi:hypothetical protein